jgi:hypothetical protein
MRRYWNKQLENLNPSTYLNFPYCQSQYYQYLLCLQNVEGHYSQLKQATFGQTWLYLQSLASWAFAIVLSLYFQKAAVES